MANKKITYEIVLDVKNGVIQTKNLEKQFDNLKTKIQQTNASSKEFNKEMGQMRSKAGLAGAAVVEIGRTISDANYGMMAMANNIQQVSTLMITLIATSGGLAGGLRELWRAFMGPLGLIVVFQAAIAWLEKMDRQKKQNIASTNKMAEAYKNAATELELMLELDNTLTEQERQNIEVRIHNLKEEARLRAQIAQIQKLQADLLKVEAANAEDFVPWYQQLWTAISSGSLKPGAFGPNQTFITEMLGLGEEGRKEQIAAIHEQLSQIIADVDVNTLRRLTDEKDAGGKKKKDVAKLFLFPEAIANAGFGQDPIGLLEAYQMHKEAELEITKRMNAQIVAAEQLAAERRIDTMQAIGQGMMDLGYAIGRATAAGKGVAVAGALIDTYAAAAAILKNAGKTPAGGIPGYAIAQAASAVAFGLAQVRQILDVKVPGQGGGGGSSAGASTTEVTPQFNIIGQTGPNRIGEAVRSALADRPVKAYVTTKDIRSGQELDRNTRSGAVL